MQMIAVGYRATGGYGKDPILVRLERESSNSLMDELAAWNEVLKAHEDELRLFVKPAPGPRP